MSENSKASVEFLNNEAMVPDGTTINQLILTLGSERVVMEGSPDSKWENSTISVDRLNNLAVATYVENKKWRMKVYHFPMDRKLMAQKSENIKNI